jgi:ParB family transcriptional regulator, chromosome partitioning protein
MSTPTQLTVRAEYLHPDHANRPKQSGQEDLRGLARTIRLFGVLYPLFAEPIGGRPGHYLIKDGHRRFEAGQIAGLSEFPVTLHKPLRFGGVSSPAVSHAVLALVTQQRAGLHPVETAMLYGALRDAGMSVADIERITGRTGATISYHLQLLDASDDTLDAVLDGRLTAGQVHEHVTIARAAAAARPRRGRPGTKPAAYFNAGHRLATAAAAACKAAGHPAAGRIGRVACGPCWDLAIGEAAVAAALAARLADILPDLDTGGKPQVSALL